MLASFPKVTKPYSVRKPWSRRFRLLHCRLTPRLQRTPTNIRIDLILPELRSVRYIFAADSMGLSSFAFSWWAPRKRMYFETECVMAVQDHPRSLISVSIESAYATSYWSSIVTLVLSCPVSEMLQVFCSQQRPHTYSTRILRVFSLD